MHRRAAVLVAVLVACCDRSPLGPVPEPLSPRATIEGPTAVDRARVTALTWNVYVGAEVGRVLQARTAEEAIALATEEWAHVPATNFRARAGMLASAIAARRPHVGGLEA